MDPEIDEILEQNWTSIDLYYKGVHVKKSISKSMKPSELITAIDAYLAVGFLPSWNPETNKASVQPTQTVLTELGVCDKCGAKNALSKQGKIYCSAKCWLKPQ